jgi:hypothetical protein
MTSSSRKEDGSTPPKFAIANGFAIGHIPKVLAYRDSNGEICRMTIDPENDLDEKLSAAIAPVRPFGFVHAFTVGEPEVYHWPFLFFQCEPESHWWSYEQIQWRKCRQKYPCCIVW